MIDACAATMRVCSKYWDELAFADEANMAGFDVNAGYGDRWILYQGIMAEGSAMIGSVGIQA